MGIRGLTSLIKKHIPEAITVHNFDYFKITNYKKKSKSVNQAHYNNW